MAIPSAVKLCSAIDLLKNICRCCLIEDGSKDIYEAYFVSPVIGIEVYNDMLKESFNIELSQDTRKGKLICNECIGKLRNACEFKHMVLTSEQKLTKQARTWSGVRSYAPNFQRIYQASRNKSLKPIEYSDIKIKKDLQEEDIKEDNEIKEDPIDLVDNEIVKDLPDPCNDPMAHAQFDSMDYKWSNVPSVTNNNAKTSLECRMRKKSAKAADAQRQGIPSLVKKTMTATERIRLHRLRMRRAKMTLNESQSSNHGSSSVLINPKICAVTSRPTPQSVKTTNLNPLQSPIVSNTTQTRTSRLTSRERNRRIISRRKNQQLMDNLRLHILPNEDVGINQDLSLPSTPKLQLSSPEETKEGNEIKEEPIDVVDNEILQDMPEPLNNPVDNIQGDPKDRPRPDEPLFTVSIVKTESYSANTKGVVNTETEPCAKSTKNIINNNNKFKEKTGMKKEKQTSRSKVMKSKRGEFNKKADRKDEPRQSKPPPMLERNILNVLRENAINLMSNSTLLPFKYKAHTYSCFCCEALFKNTKYLREHTDNVHTVEEINVNIFKSLREGTSIKVDVSIIKCKLCKSTELQDLSALETHLTHAHEIKFDVELDGLLLPFKTGTAENMQCHTCSKSFLNFGTLSQHAHGHLKSYCCTICRLQCWNTDVLNKHLVAMHLDCYCVQCEHLFRTPVQKNRHIKSGHEKISLRTRYDCPYCYVGFTEDMDRIQHVLEKHSKDPPKYKCKLCLEVFVTESLKQNHTKTMHS